MAFHPSLFFQPLPRLKANTTPEPGETTAKPVAKVLPLKRPQPKAGKAS